jgi:hypothetical protein
MAIELTIQHGSTIMYPAVVAPIKIEQERSGSPSKMTFTVIKDGNLNFQEGDSVRFLYNGEKIFFGYVFSKSRQKEQHIEVTAYDQMRYLKNKFTYVFVNKTATEIIQMICSDFGIKTGEMEDTGYKLPSLIEENKSLFDIILDALDETLANTGQLYIMYDNFGSIELKNLGNMTTDVLIDKDTAEDFDYKSSIDEETYNKVVLYYVDESTNDRIPFVARDENNIEQWGLLQYFEEVKVPSIGQSKADALLQLYNKKTRTLKINKAFGNTKVRAGSLIVVQLGLGDIDVNNYLLVEKATHTFDHDHYTMDLTMNGNFGD